ncbi:hypothetical protein EP331_00565 [bacterium]|nr:MAG: hypothetical protein EP331_00565 [bacterium]
MFTSKWELVILPNKFLEVRTDTFAIDKNGNWYHRFENSYYKAYSKSDFLNGDSFEINYYDTLHSLNEIQLCTARYIPKGIRVINGNNYWLYVRKNFVNGVEKEYNIYVFFDFKYGEVIIRHFDRYLIMRNPKMNGNCDEYLSIH